jgi:hypothetical protein
MKACYQAAINYHATSLVTSFLLQVITWKVMKNWGIWMSRSLWDNFDKQMIFMWFITDVSTSHRWRNGHNCYSGHSAPAWQTEDMPKHIMTAIWHSNSY